MFKKWRIKRLKIKLSGLKAKEEAYMLIMQGSTIASCYFDGYVSVRKNIAETEELIRQLEGANAKNR